MPPWARRTRPRRPGSGPTWCSSSATAAGSTCPPAPTRARCSKPRRSSKASSGLDMAVIHNTTMSPTKLELLARWLPEQAWYRGTADQLSRAGGFRLDDPGGEVGIELMVVGSGDGTAHL